MAEPTVRPATLDDADFLSHLMWLGHRADHPEAPDDAPATWIEGATADACEQVRGQVENSSTYVIELGAERVGRLRVVRMDDRHVIGGIQLVPGHRSHGIGTVIITNLVREAQAKAVPIELAVSKNNPNAERLYTRLGFRRTGEDGDDYLMTNG